MQRYRFSILVLLAGLAGKAGDAAEVSSPRHGVIAADKDHVVRYDVEGKPVWVLEQVGPVHRLQQLPNGNLLTQDGWTQLIEVAPDKKVVWSYDAANANGNAGKKLELHGFQRLDDGRTMIVENGIGRVIEVDPAGKIVHQFFYKVAQFSPHRDVRQARKLPNDNYLLCHEGEGRVTEYAPDGKIVWDFPVPLFGKQLAPGHGPEAYGNQVYNALRLENGNTLIATGNGHAVLEVNPAKEIVWSLHQHDLPGITLAWTTTLEVLPNGNIIVGNCHAGSGNPQLIEVTRDKQVAWTFRDFDLLGDATAASATVATEPALR